MTRRGPFWLGCGRIGALLGAAIALALGLFLAFDLGSGHQAVAPQRHTIDVVARRYAFDPPVIHVEKGDEVRLRFASLDVVHGMLL